MLIGSPTYLSAKYLNDTWVFDTLDYKWRQIEFKDVDRKPSYVIHFSPSQCKYDLWFMRQRARSGFSFLPTPDGIILHGPSYCCARIPYNPWYSFDRWLL